MEDAQVNYKATPLQSQLSEISSLLKFRKLDEVLLLLKELRINELEQECWNIFPNIIEAANDCYKKQETFKETHSSTSNVLVNIIKLLLGSQTPKEGVVLCLSEIQNAKSAAVFDILVEQISRLLIEHKVYSPDSFFWVIEGITTHFLSLPIPEEPKCQERTERKLMDNSVEVLEILDRYTPFWKFLDEQLQFMIKAGYYVNIPMHIRLRYSVRLVAPLGTTLGLMDISGPEKGNEAPSYQYVCAVRIVDVIERLYEPMLVLELGKHRSSARQDETVNLDTKSAGVLAYIVFCLTRRFPRVFSARFLAEMLFTFSLHLLNSSKQMHVLKGIALVNESLAYVNLTVGDESQQLNALRTLRALFDVMTSCSLEEGRKDALAAWKQLYRKLPVELRPQTIRALFFALENPSVRGFLLDTLRAHLAESGSDELVQEIIQRLIFLPDDETTDLLHHSEYLLASLAMLRHFYLNRILSGRNSELDSYLMKFKKALQLSRAHFELQLRNENNADKQLVSSVLPNIPPDIERNILCQSLTRFDLMESLLGIVQSAYDSSCSTTETD